MKELKDILEISDLVVYDKKIYYVHTLARNTQSAHIRRRFIDENDGSSSMSNLIKVPISKLTLYAIQRDDIIEIVSSRFGTSEKIVVIVVDIVHDMTNLDKINIIYKKYSNIEDVNRIMNLQNFLRNIITFL